MHAINHFDRLPTELLIEIFSATFDTLFGPSRSTFPYTLLSVCRRWHSTCLSTSCVWSYIKVDKTSNPSIQALKRQIWLAGTQNLDMDFEWRTDIAEEPLQELFEVIKPLVGRWRSVKMTLPCAEAVLETLGIVIHPSTPVNPPLTSLQIVYSGPSFQLSPENPSLWETIAFPRCLALDIPASLFSPIYFAAFPNLTTCILRSGTVSVQELAEILDTCPVIEDLQIISSTCVVPLLGAQYEIHAPSLRRFAIIPSFHSWDPEQILASVMRCLIAPQLRELSVGFLQYQSWTWHLGSDGDEWDRRFPQLETLELRNIVAIPQSIIRLFRQCGHVKHIHIRHDAKSFSKLAERTKPASRLQATPVDKILAILASPSAGTGMPRPQTLAARRASLEALQRVVSAGFLSTLRIHVNDLKLYDCSVVEDAQEVFGANISVEIYGEAGDEDDVE
ncbi:hypothetical protein FRB99_000009 [Tulasnella sp. 403]|nr:hypothetical protein FRB99_000009 [Tulasnella sp. 403]